MSEFEEYITGKLDLGEVHAARGRAIAAGVCLDAPIGCGQLAVVFRDELSHREYQITGLCQVCQDNRERYYAQQEAEYEREERLALPDYDPEPEEGYGEAPNYYDRHEYDYDEPPF